MPDAKCHRRWCLAGLMPPPTPHRPCAGGRMAKLAAEHGMPAGAFFCEWHPTRPEPCLIVDLSDALNTKR
eukprot:4297948-Prymnesium_polylepis.1